MADGEHRLLRRGTALALLLLLAFVLNGSYLRGGFQGEDFMFVGLLREEPLPVPRWKGLWATTDYPALTSIWWFEGQGVTPFWRPVPSLLIEGSVRLFGERPFPLHLLSIVLHGLVGGALYLLVRALTGRPLVALLAGVFFLTTEDHSMVVGWIATMTDLVCALFLCLALLAHVHWLATRKPWALAAALAALWPALLSKESAVIAPLAMVLLTILLPKGRDAPTPSPRAGAAALRDVISWVPAVLTLVAYLLLYRLAGFGGISSGLYVDPLADPGGYLVHLIGHLPVMWLATASPIPPSLPLFFPSALPALAVAGLVAFLLFALALRPILRRGVAAFAAVFYLLALLPQMAADASERALYIPTLGSSILFALLLVHLGPIARRIAPEAPRPPRMTRIGARAALLLVLVPGALLSAAYPFFYLHSFEKPARQAESLFPHLAPSPEHLLILNAPGPLHTFYLHPIVAFQAGPDTDIRILSAMCGVTEVERENDRTFVLRVDRKGWLTNIFAGAIRAPGRLRPDRAFDRGFLRATFHDLTKDRRDARAVRFETTLPLDDPRVLVVYWDGEAFRPLDLAGQPVGEAARLADTTDPWGGMW